jgi:hypothetical protein
MNVQAVTTLVRGLLAQSRGSDAMPVISTPVYWHGLAMTVAEAEAALQALEALQGRSRQGLNGIQLGGEITKLSAVGAGLLAAVAGVVMTIFSTTALVGVAVCVSGLGTAAIGRMVGLGIVRIGDQYANRSNHQLQGYITTLRAAIDAASP